MTAGKDRQNHALERLVFFSDAVFAIAITLLIIDIHVPQVPGGSPSSAYLEALGALWPSFFGFFVSFFVIGAFWAGHHRAFARTAHYSDLLVGPNLMMLCAIAFMPFATAFMSANAGALVPSIVYDLTLLITGLLNIRLVRLATSAPIVDESVPPDVIATVRLRGVAVVLGALSALAVACWDPRFGQIALSTIPVWRRLLQHRARLGGVALA